ncbi:hypothetical protein K227x_35370 [Rubripirellula lacrimiformis]|uniref:Secreted protein n=3 Tax=Pirellulaceae TaxID=2691357 RepID=A0A5C6F0A6_9BACT|nr:MULTISPECIES: hypothetical protein [Pirellulaceae]EMI44935.1 secreted protein [Rhodopirellula sp. SWK7]QDT05138.1 hypothetical protein K227x_35370 [Rubripirellula lacrimiformis]QDV55376.1 hypothetical protein Mal33_13470 [Rosistilla oblonga]TWU54818.1 hypothetical protein Poly51_35370 [Rubripirellula tenax]
MNRAFAIAALAAGLFAFAGNTGATASDYFHGGHGGHHAYSGGHHGGGHHGGYAQAPVQTYGNYGYSSNYGGYGYGQTYQPSYQPQYQQQYSPTYRSQPYRQRGGLHLDIGRFHVLGAGGHH